VRELSSATIWGWRSEEIEAGPLISVKHHTTAPKQILLSGHIDTVFSPEDNFQKASLQGENPRSTEYRLLGQVTKALMDSADAGSADLRRKAEALDWNRRVWSAFATDCASSENAWAVSCSA